MDEAMPRSSRPVMVLGATGYVGTRLVPRLVLAGHRVRAVGRSLSKLRARSYAALPEVELAAADARDEDSLQEAMAGCGALVYLIHSMEPGVKDFAARDRDAASTVARAARAAGIERIVYLGGLGDPGKPLSEHLRSRHEVAELLASTGIPVTTLRAAMILGSGSGSFEILRYLTERLPVMIAPRWLRTPVQPIAIRNVLGYLVGVLDAPATVGRSFDIGGPEVTSYQGLIDVYAEEAGLSRRRILDVPLLTPRLSSYWIQLVTPAPASLSRPLSEGLRNAVVCHDDAIRAILPQTLLTPREAIRLAIDAQQLGDVDSHWSDAGPLPPAAWTSPADPAWTGGAVFRDERTRVVAVPPERAWRPLARIGGEAGYYHADWLWRLRGSLDKLVGGVGRGRGRLGAERRAGDALDYWRVVAIEPGHRLELVAEMKLPGRGVIEWTVEPVEGGSRIHQRASFQARGVLGLLYWKALVPVHDALFRGVLDGIAREAEAV